MKYYKIRRMNDGAYFVLEDNEGCLYSKDIKAGTLYTNKDVHERIKQLREAGEFVTFEEYDMTIGGK